MQDINKNLVLSAFEAAFGDASNARVFFAPGRVNLIGEHTDYNGGHVLPCALTIGTYAAVKLRSDEKFRFYSENFKELGVIEEGNFSVYPLGVVSALKARGFKIDKGFDIAFYGNIPNCSGLSSSASIEVLTAHVIKTLFGFDISATDVALICQEAENKYVGVNCGIMDQFIIANGKAEHATFLDTSTLKFDYIPVKLGNAKLVIACSNKKRGLADSKYNERRAECEKAVSEIGNIENLGELNEEQFEKVKDNISSDTIRRRARHAVYENQRTIKACECLKANDIETFGKLMIDSHMSLKDDYEVTGIELDTLFFAAIKQKGVIGSRMTGAGFGGCTVSIVLNDCVGDFIEAVSKEYTDTVGLKADFYVVEIGGGPCEL